MSSGEVRQINGKRVATPEYRTWQAMKNRTTNQKTRDYKYYGGRGITLDPSWHDFDAFLKDMGRKPDLSYTLERVITSQGYGPGNCIWATRRTQARNRPTYNKVDLPTANLIRKLYAAGGVTQFDLASQFGITQAHVSQIIRNVVWKSWNK